MAESWAQFLMRYYLQLKPGRLPKGFSWLHPQQEPAVQQTMALFFDKYFNDTQPRLLMLGINPGRFGAGVTGVNFTAPKQLTHPCNIPHPFGSQTELSAEFIYDMIAAYGEPELFYNQVFIGSVCPLGFVKGGKNINYYDDKTLLAAVSPFIINSMQQLANCNIDRRRCVCIGGEKNYKHLNQWNEQHQWFDTIIPVPHPRFIMQYRRKEKHQFIDAYLHALIL
ncbi:Uracil DNA glycosylase superfamily protein [Cnuella takakiae]|uniref:Uracil DNA glycosylase superfamily protein n=1 Tax=Cnuella takakiae TaxID=1302690 RepID=A0A1M5IF67_9BACT|nr:uracil-DNA glycosylase family protein [Cnuella takakiae]SHG26473.1 Uracil DNA glycosylase superfamily protein [Cnuella takakiae]